LQAAARQNVEEAIRLFHEEQAGEFPGLVRALRLLMKPETLNQAQDDPVIQLIAAPCWIKEKFFYPQALAHQFPKQADELLSLAFLNDVQVDWEKELEAKTQGGLACLALAKKGVNVSQTIETLYYEDKQFKTLTSWLILDPTAALNAAYDHAFIEDQFNLMALHGDPALVSERAHQFLSVCDDLVRDGLMLLFGELPDTRCIFNEGLNGPEWFFEPVHVKELCAKAPKKRSPEETHTLLSNSKGTSMDYFRLREKFYGNH